MRNVQKVVQRVIYFTSNILKVTRYVQNNIFILKCIKHNKIITKGATVSSNITHRCSGLFVGHSPCMQEIGV